MKKLGITAMVLIALFVLAACGNASGEQAVVESDAGNITKDQFYEQMKQSSGQQVLSEMVTVQVLENNYDVSEEQVDNEVQSLKDMYGDQYEMMVNQMFGGEDQLRYVVRVGLLQEQAIAEDVEVTEEEMQEQYDRMSQEISAQHILVQDEQTANEVLSQLEQGTNFEDLVTEYSQDPGTVEQDGDLGYFSAGDMMPAFEDAAYSLEPGETSEPVQTEAGWHIIRVNDVRETENVGSYEEMKSTIYRQLLYQKMDPMALQQKINNLVHNANIQVNIEEFQDMFTPPEEQQNQQQQGQQQQNEGNTGESSSGEGTSEENQNNTESEGNSDDSQSENNQQDSTAPQNNADNAGSSENEETSADSEGTQ